MLKPFARCCALLACVGLSPAATAATWNYISAGNEETLYFFDSDTVERSSNVETLWIKTDQVSSPDKGGAWSTALRWRMNCSARTIQTLAWSDYDNAGNFIRSNNKSGTANLALPDSTGEAVLKIACQANFPRDTSGKDYFILDENDVFRARDKYVRYLNTQSDTAPK